MFHVKPLIRLWLVRYLPLTVYSEIGVPRETGLPTKVRATKLAQGVSRETVGHCLRRLKLPRAFHAEECVLVSLARIDLGGLPQNIGVPRETGPYEGAIEVFHVKPVADRYCARSHARYLDFWPYA
jgi:hypothetical protein